MPARVDVAAGGRRGESARIDRIDVDVGALGREQDSLHSIVEIGHLALGVSSAERDEHRLQEVGIERHTAAHQEHDFAPVGDASQLIDDQPQPDHQPIGTGRPLQPVNGGVQPAAVSRQVLRLIVESCQHDGSEIRRAEPIDDRVPNLLRCSQAHQVERERVEIDDHEPLVLQVVALDIQRDLGERRRGCAGRSRQVNRRERHDGPRRAVFENPEIVRRQVADRQAVAIDHRHVELDQIGPRTKRLLLPRDCRRPRDPGGDDQRAQLAGGWPTNDPVRRLCHAAIGSKTPT